MNEIGKFSAKLIFYLVAAVLLFWTASLTVAFVDAALPGMPWYIPYLSLVIFDAGMIAWLYVFLRHAQGTIQRATALIATAVNFVGVGLMVLAEVLLGGQSLVAAPENLGTAAIWGIGIWTVINVAAVLLFHIGDPEAQKQMSIQNEKDAIWRGALQQLASLRTTHSQQLTAELGNRLYRDLLDELFMDANGNGRPDIFEGAAIPATATTAPTGFKLHADGVPLESRYATYEEARAAAEELLVTDRLARVVLMFAPNGEVVGSLTATDFLQRQPPQPQPNGNGRNRPW
jgi:hypothetical protein